MYNLPVPNIRPEDLSPFGRLALRLDQEFAELARAGEQMARVDAESDAGLDEGLKILNRVAQRGQSLAGTMQQFSQALQEARDKAEAATRLVAQRAQLLKERRLRQDQLEERLSRIKDELKAAGAGLAAASKPLPGRPTEDDKRRIAAELQKVLEPLDGFIAAALAVKAEAGAGNFKRLERQADSIIDSLRASRLKLSQALDAR